jgi:GTP cyclohydrolase II
MEIFQAEKIATVKDRSKRICHVCGKKMTRVKLILESDTGDVLHMFECRCGERIWIE